MEAFLGFSDAIGAVTVRGTSDDLSWMSESFPLLFDKDMALKPAFWAWADPAQLPSEQPDDAGLARGTYWALMSATTMPQPMADKRCSISVT
jgi:hypothetical protein